MYDNEKNLEQDENYYNQYLHDKIVNLYLNIFKYQSENKFYLENIISKEIYEIIEYFDMYAMGGNSLVTLIQSSIYSLKHSHMIPDMFNDCLKYLRPVLKDFLLYDRLTINDKIILLDNFINLCHINGYMLEYIDLDYDQLEEDRETKIQEYIESNTLIET